MGKLFCPETCYSEDIQNSNITAHFPLDTSIVDKFTIETVSTIIILDSRYGMEFSIKSVTIK